MAFTFSERQKLVAPKLLDDDDDAVSESRSITRNESWILNGCGSSGSSWSALSSPLGSELGSTETETVSDEEDDDDGFIAELTRQMADYMLEEDDEKEKPSEKCCSENLNKDFAGSPPDSVSESDSELGSTITQHRPISVPAETLQAFSDDQSRAVHFYQLENQPSVENQGYVSWGKGRKKTELTHPHGQKQRLRHPKPHQIQNKGRAAAVNPGGFWLPAMAWPALQTNSQQQKQQVGSGSAMRAVFLGGSGSRNGSSGTGVFLPRGTGDPSEVRKNSKKPGCPTVLIPARVLHTLQLHFQDINTRRSQSNTRPGFTSDPIRQDASGARSDEQHSHQKRRAQSQTDDDHRPYEDMGLPQEWTY